MMESTRVVMHSEQNFDFHKHRLESLPLPRASKRAVYWLCDAYSMNEQVFGDIDIVLLHVP